MHSTEIIADDEFTQETYQTTNNITDDLDEDNTYTYINNFDIDVYGKIKDKEGHVAVAIVKKHYCTLYSKYNRNLIYTLPQYIMKDHYAGIKKFYNNNNIHNNIHNNNIISKSAVKNHLWQNGIKQPDFDLSDLSIEWVKKRIPFHIETGIGGETIKTVNDYNWLYSKSFNHENLYINRDNDTFAMLISNNTLNDTFHTIINYQDYIEMNFIYNKNDISEYLTDCCYYTDKMIEKNELTDCDDIRLVWIPLRTRFTIIDNGLYEDVVLYNDINWIH